MTTLRTAAQQALEALELGHAAADAEAQQYHAAMAGYRTERHAQMDAEVQQIAQAITALKAALAQEQEPVAWLQPKAVDAQTRPDLGYETCSSADYGAFPVYRAPPKAEPVQEPVAWMPIEQMYPQAKAIDILMGDGSILCSVLPQFDGDLWWEGSGTGEKFIDPKYANVTHWRIHGETRPEPVQEPAYKVKVTGRWHETEPLAAAFSLPDGEHSLYTAPPQRKPLTEEEIDTLWRAPMSADWEHREFARAIEWAHGIIESEIKGDKA